MVKFLILFFVTFSFCNNNIEENNSKPVNSKLADDTFYVRKKNFTSYKILDSINTYGTDMPDTSTSGIYLVVYKINESDLKKTLLNSSRFLKLPLDTDHTPGMIKEKFLSKNDKGFYRIIQDHNKVTFFRLEILNLSKSVYIQFQSSY